MDQINVKLIDRVFPSEAELNILQSGVKQIGRIEILANDNSFLRKFASLIKET